jgi:carboxylesterase type B
VTSEDCLNLNVYRPNTNETSLPVFFYVHGGSFSEGSNQGPLYMYDGTKLATSQRVVVVSANYRLQALGFMVTDDLDGNYGLKDQVAAMEWIQSNIKAFGGDSARVTLWGQSAGAMSAGLHLTSGAATQGLFQRVLMESNPFAIGYQTQSFARDYGRQVAKAVGCMTKGLLPKPDSDCLRTQNATTLLKAGEKVKVQAEAKAGLPARAVTNFGLLQFALPFKPGERAPSAVIDPSSYKY